MKRIHLLRVEEEAERFAELVEAVGADGGRVGWLELGGSAEPPTSLEGAAGIGSFRAVTVAPGRVLSLKPLSGEPTLKDLLREHFLGCRLVLVTGSIDAPLLASGPGGWKVTTEHESKGYTTDELVRALRRPRPWGSISPNP